MKKYNKYFALFGGWFGLHRYAVGEIKSGLLYTFTVGLFCFGWLYDIIKAFASDDDIWLRLPDASSQNSADAIWQRWSDVAGESADARKMRAMNGELTAIRISLDSKKAIFLGSEGYTYHTTLIKCSCPDFQKRNVPCKHMYYLAHKCGIDI